MSAGRNKNNKTRHRKAQQLKVRQRKALALMKRRKHHAQQRLVVRRWKAKFLKMWLKQQAAVAI